MVLREVPKQTHIKSTIPGGEGGGGTTTHLGFITSDKFWLTLPADSALVVAAGNGLPLGQMCWHSAEDPDWPVV